MESLKIHKVPEEIIQNLPASKQELIVHVSGMDNNELSETIKAAQEKFIELVDTKDESLKDFKNKVDLVRMVSINELANRINANTEQNIETLLSQKVSDNEISMEEFKRFKQLKESGHDEEARKQLAMWGSRGILNIEDLAA